MWQHLWGWSSSPIVTEINIEEDEKYLYNEEVANAIGTIKSVPLNFN